MAIDFPASPSVNDTYTVGSTTWTWDGTKWTITSGAAGATDKIEEGNTSAEVIDTGSDGRFVVTTEGAERARIDNSGRLLVGLSSAYGTAFTTPIQVKASGSLAGGYSIITANNENAGGITLASSSTNALNISADPDNLRASSQISFTVDATERMRIGNNGFFRFFDSSGEGLFVSSSQSAGTTYSLFAGLHSASGIATGTYSVVIRTNGNVLNTNNSYGQLTSDERFKQDIVDANSQWDDIKNVRITNYRWKSDPTGPMLIGPIAQELQAVSPGLVDTRVAEKEDESASGGLVSEGDEVLSFKASILYMKAVKALQEAQLRIETLEAQNADILARLTALEGGTP